MQAPIAFFDLDKTLLAQNSGNLWIKFELRGGHVSWRQAARGWAWLVGYHLGYTDIQPVLREAIRTLRDTPETAIVERTHRFYETEVRGLVRPGALRALDRSAGGAG